MCHTEHRITLLLQCNPLLHLLSDLIEDHMYVLFSFLCLSEEHPQLVGKLSLLKQLIQGYSENLFSKVVHLLLINFSLKMLRNIFLLYPQGSPLSSLINLHRL